MHFVRSVLAALAIVADAIGALAGEPLRIDIATAEASLDLATGEPVISLTLSEDSARAFGKLTSENIGKVVELQIDGEVVMAPIVREPILQGTVQISGNLTLAVATEMANRIKSGDAKVEVAVKDE